jgi:pantoate--beta-alanine ligase
VATVVAKLFNIVGPDRAFFGQKDAQQVAVIRRMVSDLSYPVEVVACPTVRAPDGVALSSRNVYLSPEERSHATVLVRSLETGEQVLRSGGTTDAAQEHMWNELVVEDGVEPGYAAAVDPVSFGPPLPNTAILLAVAARVGSTRLIDNRLVDPSQ